MDVHLTEEERAKGNKRNRRGKKPSKAVLEILNFTLQKTVRARFNPKRYVNETILYGLIMRSRDIAKHLEEMYDKNIPHYVDDHN